MTEYPDADALDRAVRDLMRTGFVLRAELDRVVSASLGINQAMSNTLGVIEGADEPLTPSEISDRTLISSATMTSTWTARRQGWIRHVPTPATPAAPGRAHRRGAVVYDVLPGIPGSLERHDRLTPPSGRSSWSCWQVLAGAARVTDVEPMPSRVDGSGVPTHDESAGPLITGRLSV